ncbi:MAG TPA: hypothetical protein PKD91_00055 [Bacteroidia bacterium]|nr:hypothetical protein [Bacteroidia bacterium]
MAKIKNRLGASTLIETLIAMIVLFISFVACSAIIVNTIGSSQIPEKVAAEMVISDFVDRTRENAEFYDSETSFDEYTIKRNVYPYKDYINLLVVEIRVLNNRNIEITNRKIIVAANEK